MPLSYTAVAVALVLTVVAVAYGTQAPSLGVAEFAPTARQAIESPPSTGDAGSGATGRGRARATTTTQPQVEATGPQDTSSGPPTSIAARGRRCYGNPPRQIPDPRSPSCIPTIFEGDNGGSTAKGVSATEIRVAVPLAGSWDETDMKPFVGALFEYLNRNFEFYGRRLVPLIVSKNTPDATTARAFGAEMGALGVFATATGASEWGWGQTAGQEPLYNELARNKVITIANGTGMWLSDRTMYDPLHPYLWSVHPSSEDLQRNLASFACSALVGRVAKHAPDSELRQTTRKFGVISGGIWEIPASRELVSALRACDAEVVTFSTSGSDFSSSTKVRTGLSQFQGADVTTMVCVCEAYGAHNLYSEATRMNYGAEWLLSSVVTPDDEIDWQWSLHTNAAIPPAIFGPQERAKLVFWQTEPWYQVANEIDPELLTDQVMWSASLYGRAIMDQLLVLASGVQGAGPLLTPDTFGQALTAMVFPNTGAGQAPDYQPTVGFGPGDHSFYDDYAIVWWNDAQTPMHSASTVGKGTWCYLDAGNRYSVGKYPADADDRLFRTDLPCT